MADTDGIDDAKQFASMRQEVLLVALQNGLLVGPYLFEISYREFMIHQVAREEERKT